MTNKDYKRLSDTGIPTTTPEDVYNRLYELENAIEHAAVFSRDRLILPEFLPSHIVHPVAAALSNPGSGTRLLADAERAHIRQVLEYAGNNRAKAARMLGISPTTLWRRMKEWDAR